MGPRTPLRGAGLPMWHLAFAVLVLLASAPQVHGQTNGQIQTMVVCGSSPRPSPMHGEVRSHSTAGSSQYAPSTNCLFTIFRPTNGCVNFTAMFISAEPGFDRLHVSAADGSISSEITSVGQGGSFCSADTLVRWQTDSTIQNLGFRLSWVLTCGAGSYLSGSSCLTCPSNTFQPARTNALSCTTMTSCTAAQVESVAGTSMRDRVCSARPGNHRFLCPDSQSSSVTLSGPSGTIWSGFVNDLYGDNRRCAATYIIPTGQSLRASCSYDVESGWDFVVGAVGTALQPLASNIFQSDSSSRFTGTGSFTVTALDRFQLGYITDGSVTRNVAVSCQFDLITISVCPAGQYVSGSTCLACPAGTFQSSPNTQSSCNVCPSGSFSASSGSTSCQPCGASSVSSADRRTCVVLSCDSGQFVSGSGCQACPSGTFKEGLNSATACTPCSAGTFQPTSGQAFCASCTPGSSFQSGTGMTFCAPVTPCSHGFYLLRAATASTDNVCARWTVCNSWQFLRQQGTTTRDAVCENIRVCNFNEFETVSPSSTSDRVCRPLTDCTSLPGGFFQSVAPTAFSDRQCRLATICTANLQFESAPLTATTDRQCSTLTTCTPLQWQVRAPTATSDRVCRSHGGCNSTQFQIAPATPTSPPVCAPITRCANPGHNSSSLMSPPLTSFQVAPASATSDAICRNVTRCPNNPFNGPVTAYLASPATPTSDNVCIPLTNCTLLGLTQSAPPTPTSDRVCQCSPACSSTLLQNEACDLSCNTAACSYDDGRCSVFFAETIARARIDLALQRSSVALDGFQRVCLFPVGNLTRTASATVAEEFMQLSRLKSVACLAAMNAIDALATSVASGSGSQVHRVVHGSIDWTSSLSLVSEYVRQLQTVESRLAQLESLTQQINFQSVVSSQLRGFANLAEETKALLVSEFDKLGNRITGLEQFIEGPLSRLSSDMTTQMASLGAMLQSYIGSSVVQLNERLNSVQSSFDASMSRVQSTLQKTADTQTEILMKVAEFDGDLERIATALNTTQMDLLRMSDSANRFAEHVEMSLPEHANGSQVVSEEEAIRRVWHSYSFNNKASSANSSFFTATGMVTFIRDATLSDEDLASRILDDCFFYITTSESNFSNVFNARADFANLSTVLSSLSTRLNTDTANLFERTVRSLNIDRVTPGQLFTFLCAESLISSSTTACSLWSEAVSILHPEASRQRRVIPLLGVLKAVAAPLVKRAAARLITSPMVRKAATSAGSSLTRRAASMVSTSSRSNALRSASQPAQLVRSVAQQTRSALSSTLRREVRDEGIELMRTVLRPTPSTTTQATTTTRTTTQGSRFLGQVIGSALPSVVSGVCTAAVNAVPVLRAGSAALSILTGENPCGGSSNSGTRGLNKLMSVLPVPQTVRQAVSTATAILSAPLAPVREAVSAAVNSVAPVVASVTAPVTRVLGQAVGTVANAATTLASTARSAVNSARQSASNLIRSGSSALRSAGKSLFRMFRRDLGLDQTLSQLDTLAADAAAIDLALSSLDEYAYMMTSNQLGAEQNPLAVFAQPSFRALNDKYIPMAQSTLDLSPRFVDLLRSSSATANDWHVTAQNSHASLAQRELDTFAVNRTGNCILFGNCTSARMNPAVLTRQFFQTRRAVLTEKIVNVLVNMTSQFSYTTLVEEDLIRGLTSTSTSQSFEHVVNEVRKRAGEVMSETATPQLRTVSYDITREAQPAVFRELEVTQGQTSFTIPWPRNSMYGNVRVFNEEAWAFLLPATAGVTSWPLVTLRKGPYSLFLPSVGTEYMTFFHPDISRLRTFSSQYNPSTCTRVGEQCTSCLTERFLQVSPYGEWSLTVRPSTALNLSVVDRIRVYFRVSHTFTQGTNQRMFDNDACEPICVYPPSTGFFVDSSACALATSTTAPTTTTHLAGQAVSSCPPGFQFESATRTCTPCAPGFFSAANGTAACNAWRVCVPNVEFQADAPTASSDRVCTPLQTCARGSFVAEQSTASSNRVCRACPAGTFSTTQNAFMCQAWTECAGNEFSAVTPTSILNRRCQPCTVCPVGSTVAAQCSATADTICAASWQSGANAVTCSCPTSTFLRFPCTQVTSAVCESCRSCPTNSFAILPCTSVYDTICLGCRACSAAEYQVGDCGASTDRRCEALRVCRPDEYEVTAATTTTNRACASLRVCANGEVETVAPTSSSNRVCAVLPTAPPTPSPPTPPAGWSGQPGSNIMSNDQSISPGNSGSSTSSSVPIIVGAVCAMVVVLVVVAAVVYSKRQTGSVAPNGVPQPQYGMPPAHRLGPQQGPWPTQSRQVTTMRMSPWAPGPGRGPSPYVFSFPQPDGEEGMYEEQTPMGQHQGTIVNPMYNHHAHRTPYAEMNL